MFIKRKKRYLSSLRISLSINMNCIFPVKDEEPFMRGLLTMTIVIIIAKLLVIMKEDMTQIKMLAVITIKTRKSMKVMITMKRDDNKEGSIQDNSNDII